MKDGVAAKEYVNLELLNKQVQELERSIQLTDQEIEHGILAVQMLDEKDSLYKLIDVRTQSEFEADHSPHATRIAVDEIPHRYQEIGQNDYLIFVCQAGGRSAAAAEFMVSIGSKKIFNVMGGMSSWDADRTNAAEQEAEQGK